MLANAKFSTPRASGLLGFTVGLACLFAASSVSAQAYKKLPWVDKDAAAYTAEQKKLTGDTQEAAIYRVERYLNKLKTIKADFAQYDSQGGVAYGSFYLSRPGKMRWQYKPPIPVLIVSNGDYLTYIDYEIEQVTHIPLDSTMAALLAREKITLGDDITVQDVRSGAGSIRIVLVPKDDPDEGTLILELDEEPMRLTRMIVGDASGQMTRVDLSNAEYNLPLDEVLFKFVDPRESRTRIQR